MRCGPAVMLLIGVVSVVASTSASRALAANDATSTSTKVLVVAAAALANAVAVEQSVREATAARGFVVRDADATRASLASARELGLDCGTQEGDGADACWRRVAALALDDAIIVIHRTGAGAGMTLRYLDARADVPPRVVGGSEDVVALTGALFAPPAQSASAPPPTTEPTSNAAASSNAVTSSPSAASASTAEETGPIDVGSLGVVVGATSGALAVASGVSVLVIQQAVLEDPNASGSTKATAFGAGLVLMGTTIVFAVGALLGVGMVVVAGDDDEASDVKNDVNTRVSESRVES